ncbi:MAG: HNH endonuclease signature motif containing protein [Methanobrevibacter sp.]|nr:HNH endonuclease signature motif containing protein [Methanobrevibacter sp.]
MISTRFGNAYQRKDGYYQISSGINQGKLLHRLVYEDAFGPIPEGFCVHHRDNNKENNAPDNLMILSKSHHHKLHMKGTNHPRWDNGRIDHAGGINFLSAEKNKGKTMSCVADELGYTQCVPVHQYLKNRNLRWNQL